MAIHKDSLSVRGVNLNINKSDIFLNGLSLGFTLTLSNNYILIAVMLKQIRLDKKNWLRLFFTTTLCGSGENGVSWDFTVLHTKGAWRFTPPSFLLTSGYFCPAD